MEDSAGCIPVTPNVGLDTDAALPKIRVFTQFMANCEHTQTEFMMRRDGVDYLRCVVCDQVFEADDLIETPPMGDDEADEAEVSRLQHRHRKAS